MNTIIVEPARTRRVPFARWAVAQDPKVRTASATSFAVPAHLFTHMPEELLIDSRVDGHDYVSVQLDASFQEAQAPAEPPEAAPADDTGSDNGGEANSYACPRCPRTFTTKRGRDTHARAVHDEG